MNGTTRRLLAIAIIVLVAVYAVLDLLRDPWALGWHDWDVMMTYRWYVADAIKRYGSVPFWDPHGCGGHPYWASPEMGTVVVSPLLPLYLLAPLPIAVRVEIIALLALGLAGTWRLAARFTRDPMLIALACVIGVLSSRWALQVAAGHCWHLQYAWTPWVMLAFMNAVHRPEARLRWMAVTGGLLALLAYQGAVYPLPHSLLAIGFYAAYIAYRERRWQPIALAAGAAVAGIALALPKLMPMADVMAHFPRTTKLKEMLWPHRYLRTLIWPRGEHSPDPGGGFPWAYHEFGLFIGALALAALCVGLWRAPAVRELRGLRFVGLLFAWMSVGLASPWPILHLLPPFRSQHVPSRFAYPGLMLLAVVAVAGLERMLPVWCERWRRPKLAGPVALALLFAVAVPIAIEARRCVAPGFGAREPEVARRPRYEQTHDVPAELKLDGMNGPGALATHKAGVGTILCSTFHGYNHGAWHDQKGRPQGLGARGIGDPEYRGEVYLASGTGSATIVAWSPDEVTVEVRGGTPGDRLVLNQNYDESWRANGVPTESYTSVNAHRLLAGEERVVFRYFPRTLALAMNLAGAAALALVIAGALEWRATRPRLA